jgi:hypothetical protein
MPDGSKGQIDSFNELQRRSTSPECAARYLEVVGDFDGPVAGLVGIDGGVVSGVFNLESPGVGVPGRRPRHEERYHDG